MGRCRPARDGKAKFPRVGRWQACCEKRDAASEVIVVVVVVEYIIILIIIIVAVIDSAQLQICQTVHLESSFFFKPLIFPRKVMGRQIDPFVVGLVFLWPAG